MFPSFSLWCEVPGVCTVESVSPCWPLIGRLVTISASHWSLAALSHRPQLWLSPEPWAGTPDSACIKSLHYSSVATEEDFPPWFPGTKCQNLELLFRRNKDSQWWLWWMWRCYYVCYECLSCCKCCIPSFHLPATLLWVLWVFVKWKDLSEVFEVFWIICAPRVPVLPSPGSTCHSCCHRRHNHSSYGGDNRTWS